MPEFKTDITFPEGWSEREKRMLQLMLLLALGQRMTGVAMSQLTEMLRELASRVGPPKKPIAGPAVIDAKLTVEYSAAAKAATEMVKGIFPELEIDPEFQP